MTSADSRRRFTERDTLATLLWQGVEIRCYRCKEPFSLEKDSPHYVYESQREHLHEVGLDGPDEPANCRYSSAQCHGIITNGTPATSAGSSANRIAKTRGTRSLKFVPDKRPLDETSEPVSTARCHRCGEYETECECAPMRKQAFRKTIGAHHGRN